MKTLYEKKSRLFTFKAKSILKAHYLVILIKNLMFLKGKCISTLFALIKYRGTS